MGIENDGSAFISAPLPNLLYREASGIQSPASEAFSEGLHLENDGPGSPVAAMAAARHNQ